MVTGGGGFLGQAVVRELRRRAAPTRCSCPAARTTTCGPVEGVLSALDDGRPEVVIHLAAVVGGIGANREHPGSFFYQNAIMGIQLMEEARLAGVGRFLTVGHGLLVPQVHAGALPRGDALGRLPGGDQRALRPGQEDAPGPVAGVPRRVRLRRRVRHPGEPLRAGRQLRPGLVARHPGAHPQGGRCPRPRAIREVPGLGHGLRVAGVPVRRRCGAGRRDGRGAPRRVRSRSTWASARRPPSASWWSGSATSSATAAGSPGTPASPTASRGERSTPAAPARPSGSRPECRSTTACGGPSTGGGRRARTTAPPVRVSGPRAAGSAGSMRRRSAPARLGQDSAATQGTRRRRPSSGTSIAAAYAQRTRSPWQVVRPAETPRASAPARYGPVDADFEAASMSVPDLGVLWLASGPRSWTFRAGGHARKASCCSRHVHVLARTYRAASRTGPAPGEVQRVHGTVISLGTDHAAWNYGHFLLDSLPRLALLEQAGVRARRRWTT